MWSALERQERKLECMRRHGFDGEIDQRDLGILSDVSPDDEEWDHFMEVGEICRQEEFDRHGIPLGLPSREELETNYRLNLYVRECMIMEGYPTSRPPTLDAYVESGGEIWHPYDVYVGGEAGANIFSDLGQTCPQDGFYLRTVLNLDD